jgi:hypothetical protein
VNRPSERALWNSVIETLRDTVLAHVDEPYAALQTRRLIGLAMYARDRGVDPSATRAAAIAALIDDGDPATVLLDPNDARRVALRQLLMTHLDEDLASEQVLLDHFSEPSAPPTSGLDDSIVRGDRP